VNSTLRRVGHLCADHRYLLLSGVVVAAVVVQSLNEQWSSDVFEHLAVVRELAGRPFDPGHPLLPLDASHPLYSPYTVLLGLVGNVTGLAPMTILKIAAVGNAVFLLTAYRRFARVITDQRHAAFFGLLAVLLLWGPTAWRLSGFLNLNSIGYGMPYPSTFAAALMFVALAEVDLVIREGARWGRLAVVSVSVAVILVTHPITGIATAAGILAIWFGRGRVAPKRADLPLFGALGATLILVTIWPYYSFWRLLVDNGEYSSAHFQLYEGLPLRLAPLAVLVVFLIVDRPNLRREPLLVWASIGAGLYVIGLISGQYVLGRTLAFITIAVLTKVGAIVATYFDHPEPGRARAFVIVTAGLAVIGLVVASPALLRMVPRALLPERLADDDRLAAVTDGYGFVADSVPDDAIVAAWPNELSDVVPAFAGKVESTPKPVPFVEDGDRRQEVTRRLFGGDTEQSTRRRLIEAEHIQFLLFDQREVRPNVVEALEQLGPVVYSGDGLVLVRV
jgi:alpha-1,6-mannosyltransferase